MSGRQAAHDLPDDVREILTPHLEQDATTLAAIGVAIAEKRDEAKTARATSGIETTWKEAEESYIGIDDANRHEFQEARWSKPMSVDGPVTTGRMPRPRNQRLDWDHAPVAERLIVSILFRSNRSLIEVLADGESKDVSIFLVLDGKNDLDHRNRVVAKLFSMHQGRTIWVAAAHRGDGKRFVVHAEETLTALLVEESLSVRIERALRVCE